jgi:hypothetical protein
VNAAIKTFINDTLAKLPTACWPIVGRVTAILPGFRRG